MVGRGAVWLAARTRVLMVKFVNGQAARSVMMVKCVNGFRCMAGAALQKVRRGGLASSQRQVKSRTAVGEVRRVRGNGRGCCVMLCVLGGREHKLWRVGLDGTCLLVMLLAGAGV